MSGGQPQQPQDQQQPQQYQQGGYPPQQQYQQPGGHYQQPYNPHAPHGICPRTGRPYSDKSKVIAGILQLLLGGFAIGRFYTGHVGTAIAQICVTWLTCGIGGIWPMIDGLMLLMSDDQTDAEGRPLKPN